MDTIPGGHYIGTDGNPHDANGNPITAPQETAKPSEKPSEKKSKSKEQ